MAQFRHKTVLILITVAIIVWFLPRNEGRMFRYDVGKPWMYGSVIAKFDFPIYKTDEAIKREQDSLMKQFQPYYTVNESIGSEQVSRFLHDFSQGVPGLPKEYVGLIAHQLQRLYQTGIINTTEYNRIYKDSTSMIRIINGKNVKSVPIGSFYSTIAAYERIFTMRSWQPSVSFYPVATLTIMLKLTSYMIRKEARQRKPT